MEDYQYKGTTMTPEVVKNIFPNLPLSETFQRSELVEAAESYHIHNGGKDTPVNVTFTVKKALRDLQERGDVEQTGVRGYWRKKKGFLSIEVAPESANNSDSETFAESDDLFEISTSTVTKTEDITDIAVTVVDSVAIDECLIEGYGKGSIYAYYYPSYKELAALRGESRFPIKIGRSSSRDAKTRVKNQQNTSMPETAIVAYIYHTDFPERMEGILHFMLESRGQRCEASPGNEWFMSNPKEIQSLVNTLVGALLSDAIV